MNDNGKAFTDALYQDLHKPAMEAKLAEVHLTVADIGNIRKNLKKWMKPEKKDTPILLFPADSYVYNDPYGLVCVCVCMCMYVYMYMCVCVCPYVVLFPSLVLFPTKISKTQNTDSDYRSIQLSPPIGRCPSGFGNCRW